MRPMARTSSIWEVVWKEGSDIRELERTEEGGGPRCGMELSLDIPLAMIATWVNVRGTPK